MAALAPSEVEGQSLSLAEAEVTSFEGLETQQGDGTGQPGGEESLGMFFTQLALAIAPKVRKDLGLALGISDERVMVMFQEIEGRRTGEIRDVAKNGMGRSVTDE